MTLRFAYKPEQMGYPLVPLGGRRDRPRPIIPVTVGGPTSSSLHHALVDSGSDDTVFPEWVARMIGIDLTNAPTRTAGGVATHRVTLRYAVVTLNLTDFQENREWRAWVGFTPASMRYPILGFAGCLQFFDALFHGSREKVELTVNDLYPGT